MMNTQLDEAAVREEAYLLWEKEGKPAGRETEYWLRARVLVSEKETMDTVSKPAPKAASKPKAAAAKAKAAPVKAAAGKTSKATKAKADTAKAKKK